MREIKFRGKTVDTGNWVYGSYQADVVLIGKHTIIYLDYDGYYCEEEVIPETIGQYTGLEDKNGREIYEGDIVRIWGGEYCQGYWEVAEIGEVVFEEYSFGIKSNGRFHPFNIAFDYDLEIKVIGNIYENPELLEAMK